MYEVTMELTVNKQSNNNGNKAGIRMCKHCGGHLRYYRGTLSCLMCGRDVDHVCKNCIASQELLMETA